MINRKISSVEVSAKQYTYSPILVGLGRYRVIAVEDGNKDKVVGQTEVFTVLNGGDPKCLDAASSSSSSASKTASSTSSSMSATASKTSQSTSSSSTSTPGTVAGVDTNADEAKEGGSNAGTIAGAVVGAIVGVVLIGAFIFWLCRRKRRQDAWMSDSSKKMFTDKDASHGGSGATWNAVAGVVPGLAGGRKRDSRRASHQRGLSGDRLEPISAVSSNYRSQYSPGVNQPMMTTDDRFDGALGRIDGYESKEGLEKDEGIEMNRFDPRSTTGAGVVGLGLPVLEKDHAPLSRSVENSANDNHRFAPPSAYAEVQNVSPSSVAPSTQHSHNRSWDHSGFPMMTERHQPEYFDDSVVPSSHLQATATSTRPTRNSNTAPSLYDGLQRNPSSASTTWGGISGAMMLDRSASQKRNSSGQLISNVKRKPVPQMNDQDRASLDSGSTTCLPYLNDDSGVTSETSGPLGSGGGPESNVQEVLTDDRHHSSASHGPLGGQVQRNPSQASSNASSSHLAMTDPAHHTPRQGASHATTAPGAQQQQQQSTRPVSTGNFLLIPDRPLDQD